MQRFEQVIKRLNDQLDVPLPEKANIIAEIVADLNSLYQEYREQGLDDYSAQKEAIRKVVADSEALEHFHRIKIPTIRRFVEQLPKWVRSIVEPLAMMIATSTVGILVLKSFLEFTHLSSQIFFWFILITGVSLFSVGIFLMYRLFLSKNIDLQATHFFLHALIWLGFLAGLLGLDGFLFDMWRFSYNYAQVPDTPLYKYFNAYGINGLMHLSIGFAISFAGVIFWLIGFGQLARLEYYEDVVHQIIEQS